MPRSATMPTADPPLLPTLPPIEAKLVDALPESQGRRFQPKWDGWRCLIFRDGDSVMLQALSRAPIP